MCGRYRTEAISHRIRTAGIRTQDYRRPSKSNPHRIVLSGAHEDPDASAGRRQAGRVVRRQPAMAVPHFRTENTVSAVLHMDEHTPHIHATVVPIVTGERRKARKKRADSKRQYRKKADTVRLCADDVLTREKLVSYHDSYAKAMAKYGLQRGIRGSEGTPRHHCPILP